ncbi:hypothetical protein HanXRQr2_Chr03g0117591 [Helianthus annuus]|uniref:Uncharacterized protein n=1 Tax=Helianthus annuus TaxID=4232 RepID=A0A251V8B3_HELAN|nr:hypothetical protein HanXRQr2_Chr03g0117591 [Helianthus annuus]
MVEDAYAVGHIYFWFISAWVSSWSWADIDTLCVQPSYVIEMYRYEPKFYLNDNGLSLLLLITFGSISSARTGLNLHSENSHYRMQ